MADMLVLSERVRDTIDLGESFCRKPIPPAGTILGEFVFIDPATSQQGNNVRLPLRLPNPQIPQSINSSIPGITKILYRNQPAM